MTKPPTLRCAIYTRKSSDEGLEQDFNSLDAQREACAAYIASQKHEGWIARPDRHDDGGFSGGTMQRPGLVRLMDDIRAKQVDVIVVYKVDRLTRSLADFAKMVELFDAEDVSFVAVTQQFNTTTSMGRLTLNVLLSFAQFEREIAGERIRDKIRASRQKGMWMGGTVPMGYVVANRALAVDETQAALVRQIFLRYLEVRSVYGLADALRKDGITSPRRTSSTGRVSGGRPLTSGNLYSVLTNKAYLGLAVHRGTAHPGRHEAIIAQPIWERVQALLATNRVGHKHRTRASSPSLLTGLLFDDLGERLTPTHASKSGQRYHYYVSRSLVTREPRVGARDSLRWRLPAAEVDAFVLRATTTLLRSPTDIIATLGLTDLTPAGVQELSNAGRRTAERLAGDSGDRRKILPSLIARIVIADDEISLVISRVGWLDALGQQADRNPGEVEPTTLRLPVRFTKRRVEQKIILGDADTRPPQPDDVLIRAVARAHGWLDALKQQRYRDLSEIARAERVPRTYVHALMPLAFLAPSIVTAIVDGRQPADSRWST